MAIYKITATGEEVSQELLGKYFPNTAFNWRNAIPQALVDYLGLEKIAPPAPPSLSESEVLAMVKEAKRIQINDWRIQANDTSFFYLGKAIACDALSMKDIQGTNGEVALNGALPPGFPGAWKAMDNSYVMIPDVATWKLFYRAMFNQGASNFMRSEQLKARLSAATTVEQVEALQWIEPTPPPTPAPTPAPEEQPV